MFSRSYPPSRIAATEGTDSLGHRFILLSMLAASILAGYWLWQHPNQLASDDALFFARGVDRFSVLEFSPHFPGYPFYIALAKALNLFLNDATASVLYIGRLSILLLPWLCFGLVRQLGGSVFVGGICFILVQADPLLLGLGLQGLSDAPGLCLLVGGVWALCSQRGLLAGTILGLCIATRPSFLPFLLPLLIWLLIRHRSMGIRLVIGIVTVGMICLGAMLAHDGIAYFWEGWRFVQGHFQLWGNTAVSQQQQGDWFSTLRNYFSGYQSVLLCLLLVLTVGNQLLGPRSKASIILKAPVVLVVLLASAWIWTLIAQNPSNLRHLSAPLCLLYCTAMPGFQRLIKNPTIALSTAVTLIALQISLTAHQLNWQPQPPPVSQARTWLEQSDITRVASNHGIELLRSQLSEHTVMDSHYPGSAQRLLAQGGVQLTSTISNNHKLHLQRYIPARNPAEKSIHIYSLIRAED